MPLTVAKIAALKPCAKTYEEPDEGRLTVAVSPKGKKTWRTRYYHAPSRRDFVMTLGLADHISPREARRMAAQIRDEVAAGGHPFADRKRVQEAPQAPQGARPTLVSDLVDRYCAHLHRRQAKSARATANKLNDALAPWLELPAEELTPGMLFERFDGMIDGDSGVSRALKAHQLAHAMFGYAERLELIDRNPTRSIRRADLGRDRTRRIDWLDRRDWTVIGRVRAAIEQMQDPQARRFLVALLVLGKRKGQLRMMKWSEIDGTDIWWPAPELSTRSKPVFATPLPASLMTVLLRDRVAGSDFVFASGRGGPFSAHNRYTDQLSRIAGVQFRFHDARHALGAWLSDRYSDDVRLAYHCLDHARPDRVQARYERAFSRFEDQRDALEAWRKFIANEAAKASAGNKDKTEVLSN